MKRAGVLLFNRVMQSETYFKDNTINSTNDVSGSEIARTAEIKNETLPQPTAVQSSTVKYSKT